MYDNVVKSYIKGEINRATCIEMMWTMGASRTEMYFYLQEADRQISSNVTHNDSTTQDCPCGGRNGSHQLGCEVIINKIKNG